jgi:hypothetical protein
MRIFAMNRVLLPLLLACAPLQAAAQEPETGHADPSAQAAGHDHASPPPAVQPPPADDPHAAHHDHGQNPADAATPAQRWPADAPLRAGMARVREAALALAALEQGTLQAPQVQAQADEIRAAVDSMFANCRLAPEPDAALHPLLARLIGASQALKAQPADPAPLADVRGVLQRYSELFTE